MTFFERFEQATPRIVNQLWQGDYIGTAARDEALALISPPLGVKLWTERLLLVIGALFVTVGILLFFAFNWADMPPMLKMGGILGLIGIVALVNWVLLKRGKRFAANIVLSVNAFMAGVFMAVFGQIYQTGADSYTLFLTWAIMILPWVIMARFLPLWVLWLVVANLALSLWWKLGLYPDYLKSEHILIITSIFHLVIYAIFIVAIKFGQTWLDKKWSRLLIAVLVFAPISALILGALFELRARDFDTGFWVSLTLFVLVYSYEKFIHKSLPEYSVGFFWATLIIIWAITRFIFEYTAGTLGFLLSGAIIAGLFYAAYKYYLYATREFKDELL